MSQDEQKKIPEKSVALEVSDTDKFYKKKEKSVPKKANHKHEFVPILIENHNDIKWDKERGMIKGIGYWAGSKCRICDKIKMDFPKGSQEQEEYYSSRLFLNSEELLKKFGYLEICPVEDAYKL